jgi:ureidoacrylate peracid hydrolase
MRIENVNELQHSVELANSAVLVVDVQNDWCHENGAYAQGGNDTTVLQNTVPKIDKFLANARHYRLPIIHIGTTHSKWTDSPSWRARSKSRFNIDNEVFLKPGSWGAKFYRIVPQPDEYVMMKHRYSAFVNTDLDLALRSISIRTLIMAGFASNVCVQNTALSGYMNDYYIVVLEDCTATFSTEDHEIAMSYMGRLGIVVTTSEIVVNAWGLTTEGI